MSRQRRRAWLGLLAQYLLVVVILGLVTTGIYAAVDADDRPTVLRLGVAAFVAIVLIHIYGHVRQQWDATMPSAFERAREQAPAEARIASIVLRLKEQVQYGVKSQRYFKETLWPRLVQLSDEHGTRERLREPAARPWLRRGPSLTAIADLLRRIGDDK
jgi:hypothetical protein